MAVQKFRAPIAWKLADEKRSKLRELIDVEEKYVGNLEKLQQLFEDMERSMSEPDHPVPMPAELRDGRSRLVVGNLTRILELHQRVITVGLRGSLEQPAQLRALFTREAGRMRELYGEFAATLRMKVHIVKAHAAYFRRLQRRAGLKLGLDSLLRGPLVQLVRWRPAEASDQLLPPQVPRLLRRAGARGGEGRVARRGGGAPCHRCGPAGSGAHRGQPDAG
jgi:triple functional domain protein